VNVETTTFQVTCEAGGQPLTVSARLYASAARVPHGWLILAHGAGAGHDSAFIVEYATAFSARGVSSVTFNFPYTERRRRLPDPAATLESCWKAVVRAVRERAGDAALLVAAGKSMGGRIASQVAADPETARLLSGLVFLGYPLHPPGRPEKPRIAHWPDVHLPALFVQGSRDTFASPDELRAALPRYAGVAALMVVDGGDHSFKVPRSAGRPQAAVHADVQSTILDWMRSLAPHRASSDSPAAR
jgi:uncharacterized protein